MFERTVAVSSPELFEMKTLNRRLRGTTPTAATVLVTLSGVQSIWIALNTTVTSPPGGAPAASATYTPTVPVSVFRNVATRVMGADTTNGRSLNGNVAVACVAAVGMLVATN